MARALPSFFVLAALACSACEPSRPAARPAPKDPVETWGPGPVPTPPPMPPVACAEYPADRQVTVTCRYFHEGQMDEVWRRSVQRASVIAISLGFSHVQWLGLEKRAETVRTAPTPVNCKQQWGGGFECKGGRSVEMPVAAIATTRFTLLSAEEAATRSDPLVPVERRPVDARAQASLPAR